MSAAAATCRSSGTSATAAWRAAMAALALLGIVDLVLLANGWRVIEAARAAIAYPFELDFAEGLVLTSTTALRAGEGLYPPPSGAPTRISNYPPLYYVATALLSREVDALAAGRLLSLLATLVAAAALGVLAWLAAPPTIPGAARLAVVALAAAAFVQVSYTASWAALMRVDALAVALAFLGVAVFGVTARRGAAVYASAPLFVLACFTKQTTVAAAAACIVTLARRDRRRALGLAGAIAIMIGVSAAALQIGSGGGFWYHVVSGNLHAFNWRQLAAYVQDAATRYPVLIALAFAALPRLLGALPTSAGAADARAWTRAAIGAYLPLAALVAATVGKRGAEANYLIEVMGVVCVAAAVAIGDAFEPRGPTGLEASRAARGAVVAVAALLLWQVAWVAPPRSVEVVEVPAPATWAARQSIVDRVRGADGAVLSEDLVLLARAGKPVRYQPFDVAQIMYRDRALERPMVADIAARRFALIALHFDARNPPPIALDRFTPAMLEAVRCAYTAERVDHDYWLYTPSPLGACGAGGHQ